MLPTDQITVLASKSLSGIKGEIFLEEATAVSKHFTKELRTLCHGSYYTTGLLTCGENSQTMIKVSNYGNTPNQKHSLARAKFKHIDLIFLKEKKSPENSQSNYQQMTNTLVFI